MQKVKIQLMKHIQLRKMPLFHKNVSFYYFTILIINCQSKIIFLYFNKV
jgi:hypothetical protein